MKKVLSVLAVFLLVLSLLTGCATSTDNEKAVGKWQGEWDLSHTLNAMLDESLDDGENYFNFDGFKLAVIFDFEENGNLKVSVTEESIKTAIESLKVDLKDGMRKMYQKLIDDNNYNLTVDSLLEQSNLSLDQLVEQAFSEASLEAVYKQIDGESSYNFKDGKFYGDGGMFANCYITYEFSGNKLEFKEYVGENSEKYASMYPFTLTKVE